MKIVPKLTLAMTVGAFVVMAGHTIVRVDREVELFETHMQQDQLLLGRAMAAGFADAWRRASPAEALRLLERANSAERRIHLRWVPLTDGALPADLPAHDLDRARFRAGHSVSAAVQGAGRAYYTYVPVAIAGYPGALELSQSLEPERRYVSTTIAHSVVVTSALCGSFLVVAFLLGDRLIGQPIRRLVEHARHIGAGELGRALAMPRSDEMGELARGMNAMSHDLARARERVLAETETRIDALAQLRHADRLNTVGKLASGIAHELGTPLNVVTARAKLIETAQVEGPDARANAAIIRRQAERVAAIIRQLLDFSRSRGAHLARCDLGEITREAAALLEPLAKRSQVEIVVETGPGELSAELDADQLHQVLINLMTNGIQAMPVGGRLEVRVRPEREPGGAHGAERLAVSVTDHGTGMDAETASHAFEPFFTTKPVGEGTGLGLSVSYGIVREHGGSFELETSPGLGTTFTVYLPRRHQEGGSRDA